MSIANTDDVALHGETWPHLFKLRDILAWRWFEKCSRQIPIEEFYSCGNQVLAEVVLAYRPAPHGQSLTTQLWDRLSRRMGDVWRREYRGFLAYAPGTTTRLPEQPWQAHGTPFASLSAVQEGDTRRLADRLSAGDAAQHHERSTFLWEVMHFLRTHVSETEQQALLASLDEASDIDHAQELGLHPNSFRRLRRQARAKLHTWAEEVISTAADSPHVWVSDAAGRVDA